MEKITKGAQRMEQARVCLVQIYIQYPFIVFFLCACKQRDATFPHRPSQNWRSKTFCRPFAQLRPYLSKIPWNMFCLVFFISLFALPCIPVSAPSGSSRSPLSLLLEVSIFIAADLQRAIVWERLPCLSGAQLSLYPLHAPASSPPRYSHLTELR